MLMNNELGGDYFNEVPVLFGLTTENHSIEELLLTF